MKPFDLIGDIHGCYQSLIALLEKLGYRDTDGVYRHPTRQAIFLGDFIDRGPYQREVLETVRPMIDEGAALSVMGNHEFNAIAYFTRDGSGGHLRRHSKKNKKQHRMFLKAFKSETDEYEELIGWFKSLPLWLDLGELRVVHACWDRHAMQRIAGKITPQLLLNDDLLVRASTKGDQAYVDVETLLKGKEIPLPPGQSFHDKDRNERHDIRIRWWDDSAITYRRAFLGPASARTNVPEDPICGHHLIEYAHDAPPVFLGHYWLEGCPELLAPNIACLDYSVANEKDRGKLVAYRWDGEQRLDARKFVWVDRVEPLASRPGGCARQIVRNLQRLFQHQS